MSLIGSPALAGPSLLFEPATGKVISQDRAGEPWYPASLTKLMTAYLVFGALRDKKLTLAQQIPVSAYAASMMASKIGLKPGATVTVDFALQTMLVHSANDMAVTLAEAIGATTADFVGQMNATAVRLGMTATHFVNPNGIFAAGQQTTARDLALLVSAILKEYPENRHYFNQPYVSVGKSKLRNRNMLLRMMPNADGMKTGYVCASGFNLIASAHEDGRQLVAVLFGADSALGRAQWAQELLAQGFAKPLSNEVVSVIANRTDVQPFDMSGEVCTGKGRAQVVSARVLKGHGVSLGRYRSRADAAKVLEARGAVVDAESQSSQGIVQLPKGLGYAVYDWDLDAEEAQSRCDDVTKKGGFCEVVKPEQFAALAAQAPPPRKKKPTAKPKPAKKPAAKPAPKRTAP